MLFKLTQYEVKYLGENQWKEISEKTCMELLVDNFDPITPIIADILNGKEIRTPHGIYRLKGYSNKNRVLSPTFTSQP